MHKSPRRSERKKKKNNRRNLEESGNITTVKWSRVHFFSRFRSKVSHARGQSVWHDTVIENRDSRVRVCDDDDDGRLGGKEKRRRSPIAVACGYGSLGVSPK